jgi:hypothetical protein
MGYAVVMVDFHGSSGYGEAFAKSIVGHWGDRPLEDLQKGWAYALARYPFLDGDRACALGGSYGGYMIAWIAGNWAKPWKCLVDHDGVFDIRLMSYSTDIPGFQQAQNDAADLGEARGGRALQSHRPRRRLDRADPRRAQRPRRPRAARPGHGRLRRRPAAACAERTALLPRREPLGAQAAELRRVVRDGGSLDEALAGNRGIESRGGRRADTGRRIRLKPRDSPTHGRRPRLVSAAARSLRPRGRERRRRLLRGSASGHHIDDGAIEALTGFYRQVLPAGGVLLDLMSSWVSHLPDDVAYARSSATA